MKKLFIAALIIVAAGTTAFAKDVTNLNYRVRTIFEAKFAGATNVSWSAKETYFKAVFTLSDETVEAFFATEGDLIGYSRKVDFQKLPLSSIQRIKKDYASYKVAETIEFDQDGERSYFVSLVDGAKKKILQVSLYGAVSIYQGEKN